MRSVSLAEPPPAPVAHMAMLTHRVLGAARNRIVPRKVVMLSSVLDNFFLARVIWAAAELGISDQLRDGPLSIDVLAERTGTQRDGLQRLMRALVHAGIFKQMRDGRFARNRMADCLRSDIPGSLRPVVRYLGSDWYMQSWTSLLASIQTGTPVYQRTSGQSFFEYYERNGHAAAFDGAMSCLSALVAPTIVASYDLSRAHHIVDICGGHGALLAGMLRAYPQLDGTLFERPEVIVRAQRGPHLTAHGLADRVRFEAGDAFEAVPAGFDVYCMKWVLHDFDDAAAVRLLENVRSAARSGAKLLVIEMLVEPSNVLASLSDVAMLALVGGRERTIQEYDGLFSRSRFKLNRVIRTASPYSVLEAVAA
jgi:hypothetical protein